MLLLKRKKGQRIICILENGDWITIDLREADIGIARLGIDAPRNVSILREELVTEEQRAERLMRKEEQ